MKMNKLLPSLKKIAPYYYALPAFAGTFGLCRLAKTAGMEKASYSALALVFFAVIWFFLKYTVQDIQAVTDPRAGKRRIRYSILVSFLLALSFLMGYQLQSTGYTAPGVLGKLSLLGEALCLSVAFFPLGNVFFRLAERQAPAPTAQAGAKYRPVTVFAISAAVIFLCLIPVWLAYYPIVMSYDFHRQVNEAHNGFIYFYPYQPIAHTWVIWVFYQLGQAVGSLETGFACMSLFQMLLYALVTGYAISMIYRIRPKKWIVVAAVLYFGLFPFNTVHIVCTTKDILFTILFLLFFLLIMERQFFCKPSKANAAGKKLFTRKNVIDILLVLEGCLMIQFRNNAFYAVAVFMVLFLLLVPRREKLRVLLLAVLLIGGSKLTGAGIKAAIGTELTQSKVEMFSVPIQQMARVGCFQTQNMDQATINKLNSFIPWQVWENYNPPLADTVKGSVNSQAFSENYGELFSFWLKLGLQFPNEYVDAFLELTRGYWFLDDVSWAENLGYGVEGRMGAIFTYNSSDIPGVGSIVHESRFPWLEAQLEKIVSGNSFYDWPVLSLLFKSAFYPWCMLLITLVYFYRRQREQLKLSLLPWLYMGTVLLGPVVQLRYAFPLITLLPLLAAMLLICPTPAASSEIAPAPDGDSSEEAIAAIE